MPSPFDQSTYQVRLDWGTAGLDRLAGADVVVVVDVLRFSSIVVDAVASGAEVGVAEAETWSRNGAAVAVAASRGSTVLVG
ncbi:phosphosulfolactate phosphohydrolase, partial [Microbacterium sp. H6]